MELEVECCVLCLCLIPAALRKTKVSPPSELKFCSAAPSVWSSYCDTKNRVRLAFGTVPFSDCQQVVQLLLYQRRPLWGKALCGL